jgi:UDP-N-acetylmuramate dehydrogenase
LDRAITLPKNNSHFAVIGICYTFIQMEFHTQIPLKNFTTMRLGGPARFMTDAHSPDEVQSAYRSAASQSLPVFILGGGSNVIARDAGFDGVIIRMRIPGFDIVSDDINSTIIKIGAGEDWDSVVKRTVNLHLSGMEALSAIPGSAGASPVQNVGAYGQEIADTLVSLVAYDTQQDTFVMLRNDECGFSYRHSIFRGDQMGRYIITSITVKLSKSAPQPPFYDALQTYFDEHGIQLFTPQIVRDAVTDIRTNKLPDPAIYPNTGSFFKNAIIEDWQLADLHAAHPDMPSYDMGDGRYKIPTGWLIEQVGLKGQVIHGMKVHNKNTLVLINESATSYHDLAAARDQIAASVRDKFNIQIEQEPLEI